MIDAVATRRVRFNDKLYAKDDKVPMPAQQFEDFKPTGLFERAPTEKKVTSKTADVKPSAAKD